MTSNSSQSTELMPSSQVAVCDASSRCAASLAAGVRRAVKRSWKKHYGKEQLRGLACEILMRQQERSRGVILRGAFLPLETFKRQFPRGSRWLPPVVTPVLAPIHLIMLLGLVFSTFLLLFVFSARPVFDFSSEAPVHWTTRVCPSKSDAGLVDHKKY